MKKSVLIKIVTECAQKYESELLNKSLFIICSDKNGLFSSIELFFYKRNYLHLTGVETSLHPEQFFEACIKGKLREEDINERDDGTTVQKLTVLPMLMTKNLSAKMIGDYLRGGINLLTEKMAGNTFGCMGFVIDSISGQYVPNTVIKDDIRRRVVNFKRIIAIFRNSSCKERNSEIVYLAKGVDLEYISQILNGFER